MNTDKRLEIAKFMRVSENKLSLNKRREHPIAVVLGIIEINGLE